MKVANFKERIREPELDEATNAIKFAKILFYVGEFQQGINELLNAQQLVQATTIGVALADLSLLATK